MDWNNGGVSENLRTRLLELEKEAAAASMEEEKEQEDAMFNNCYYGIGAMWASSS